MSQTNSVSLSHSEETSTSVSMSTSATSTNTEIKSQTSLASTQSSESTNATSTATSTSAISLVRPKIRVAAVTGQVNNDLVTVTSATVKDSGYTEEDNDKGVDDGTVYPHEGEPLEYTAKFTIDNKATTGDKFTFTYSPYTVPSDFDMANWTPTDIKDASGEVIATGTWDASTKTVTYTFTSYVDKYQDVVASVDFYSYIDRATVPNNLDNTNITFTLAGESASKTENITYGKPTVYGTSSIQTVFNEVDTTNNTVEQIIYINTNNAYSGATAYNNILSIYGGLLQNGTIVENGSETVNNTSTIEIYEAGNGSTLPKSMKITDYSNFKKVDSDTIASNSTYYSDRVDIDFGDINTAYVIRVVSSYDANSTDNLVQSANMYSRDASGTVFNYYNTEASNYIVTSEDTSGGSGTEVTYKSGDYVWYDTNHDGLQTNGETPAAGVQVTIEYPDGTQKTVLTDYKGHYEFDGLTDNTTYTISFTKHNGYDFTTTNVGSDTSTDSDGSSVTFTIKVSNDMTLDAGLVQIPSESNSDSTSEESSSESTSKSLSTVISESVSTSEHSSSLSASESLSTVISESTSLSSSLSGSESLSESTITLTSLSSSESVSQSLSDSVSVSDSESASESASVSASTSASVSVSESASASESTSDSTSGSGSSSESDSTSNSTSDSGSSSESGSTSDSTSNSGSSSESDSTSDSTSNSGSSSESGSTS
ncbi:hypothetical protein HMPREF9318_01130, partial [Streptococcus urinalis FB127-CNA-2]|uniref:Ig-like domain-containing protein n=1 Tax=Streptococcus urinalis TaxID=149016 RepID=UPI00029937F5